MCERENTQPGWLRQKVLEEDESNPENLDHSALRKFRLLCCSDQGVILRVKKATIGVWQIGADTRIYEQKTNGTTLETITASNPQNTAVSVEIQREGKHFMVSFNLGLPS